jgi:hypothetical protein
MLVSIMQKPDLAEHTRLADKLEELIVDYIAKFVYSDIGARLERLTLAHSKGSQLMLRKGKRLLEQTLDACQMKRIKSSCIQVEVKHVACHMANWKLLGVDFSLPDLVDAVLYAKHRCAMAMQEALHAHKNVECLVSKKSAGPALSDVLRKSRCRQAQMHAGRVN